ncbi:MAG: histone deacetylase family protein [Betaproteobacteria bacterium]|nr:histone deacetylase family protein [Betaproteobacteria bacterium]
MTAYYTHPTFLAHEMGPAHPECPQRLAAIHDHLTRKGLMALLDVREPTEVSDAAILRAHSVEHLDRLVAASPTDRPYQGLDPDTTMNHHTLRASYLAAGAVVGAVDAVLTERQRNAFCAVRPPGHHAERNTPMGFCFLNNIAIAAHHALAEYELKRILIVDFDVHHGNGTEEIFADDDRVLMVSTFEHALYPFSGDIPLGNNMVNVPLAAYSDGQAMRRAVTEHWLPAIERFRPELVLISAGFDAHREDDLSHLMWSDLDYAWISQQLVQIATQHCNGRIVSSLEGGYAIQALARSVGHHVDALLGG